MARIRSSYEIVQDETTPEILVIRDLGPWDQFMTVTSDAEAVVAALHRAGMLSNGRKLLYYDSMGYRDELAHYNGMFQGYRAGPEPRRPKKEANHGR